MVEENVSDHPITHFAVDLQISLTKLRSFWGIMSPLIVGTILGLVVYTLANGALATATGMIVILIAGLFREQKLLVLSLEWQRLAAEYPAHARVALREIQRMEKAKEI